MTGTPIRRADSLRIGTVDFVSPDEVKVLLDIEAPESVALNAGGARPFPRVNSYVLIPVEDAYLVAQIQWLTVERSAFPKRRGVQDFGLIDLPYPLRKMSLSPLGTLRHKGDSYTFRRGADALPSVGTAVLLPTEVQLRSIVESGERRRIRIGVSPLAGNAQVCVDPDRLLGRHLAVLGNTGSGKSCSVAGLLRWSLEAAHAARANGKVEGRPNARFIVLDPNGEYSRAFATSDARIQSRIFKVNPEPGGRPLEVPLWFWDSSEWAAFTQASAKTQRPLLKRALREVKAGRTSVVNASPEEKMLELRRHLSSTLITLQRSLQSGAIKNEETRFGFRLKAVAEDLRAQAVEWPALTELGTVISAIKVALDATHGVFKKPGEAPVEYYRAFTNAQVNAIISALDAAVQKLGGVIYQEGPDEDAPIPFRGAELADHLQVLAAQENVSQFTDFLVGRIRTLLSDTRIQAVVGDGASITLEKWLGEYIGESEAAGVPDNLRGLLLPSLPGWSSRRHSTPSCSVGQSNFRSSSRLMT